MNEFEYYHGAALVKLLHGYEEAIQIVTYDSPSNASYVVNKKVGLFIKHSTKRMSPWRFSFKKEHQDEIKVLKQTYGEVFTVLVCGNDGVVVLSFDEIKNILDEFHGEYEWISATRSRRQEYAVKGSDGALEWKVAKNEYPKKILEYLLRIRAY